MKVSVVMAFPATQQVVHLDVSGDCTAREAVQLAIIEGMAVEYPDFDVKAAPLGIHGIGVTDDKQLNDGDRVEIYRALQQDPMELRRKRAASESSRFSKRRK